ncbi:hypothetical protein HME9302_00333 [Alteripontixanthobacter maritimus]|uniref:Flagellar hook-associated protein 1 n=1 Tax=Alteripontixanthobacter maritimus TaxID=2161824 RepID=A0A369QA37_9SPHN|nr:flagellar hook-associated protein FlgK [Alteripontixanthobacter maritimus]RDC59148.1 hypothetical protein HME9302_00333 [Alteripontixanthobacter maritimus]
MSSNLLLIGKSGALAARSALETTGQNIANAATKGYSRRTVELGEVASSGGADFRSNVALSGVRVESIQRSSSVFLQSEARRTGSDLARADSELRSLAGALASVEQAGVYPAIVEFEASLAGLGSDPLDQSLRAAVLESARALSGTLNIAAGSLAAVSEEARFSAHDDAARVTVLASDLARTNVALTRAESGSGSRAVLLDQRDALLADMAQRIGVTATYDATGRVDVRLGDAGGPAIVSGNASFALTATDLPDGTLAYEIDTDPPAAVIPVSGRLAGTGQGLSAVRDLATQLDELAANIAQTANDAQADGITPAGAAGRPLFSGSTAATLAMSLTNGSGLATAPASAGANSRNTANLAALRAALANSGPASTADAILFGVSSAVAARSVTREALSAIAETAQVSLTRETGVDLDSEAANLLRFQQAFQASGRVIQVASDIFDTLLAIR